MRMGRHRESWGKKCHCQFSQLTFCPENTGNNCTWCSPPQNRASFIPANMNTLGKRIIEKTLEDFRRKKNPVNKIEQQVFERILLFPAQCSQNLLLQSSIHIRKKNREIKGKPRIHFKAKALKNHFLTLQIFRIKPGDTLSTL